MAFTQLQVYNQTLLDLGERQLASLSENRKPRRLLDSVWNDANAIRYCLARGPWEFAIRTLQMSPDDSLTPDFGYRQVYTKPDDFVTLTGISGDEKFNDPLTRYAYERGYFFCDLNLLYLRYVSDDDEYGRDTSLWSESFMLYVAAYKAQRVAKAITGSQTDADAMEKLAKQRLDKALDELGHNQPTVFLPAGSWTRSRTNGITARNNGERGRY